MHKKSKWDGARTAGRLPGLVLDAYDVDVGWGEPEGKQRFEPRRERDGVASSRLKHA